MTTFIDHDDAEEFNELDYDLTGADDSESEPGGWDSADQPDWDDA